MKIIGLDKNDSFHIEDPEKIFFNMLEATNDEPILLGNDLEFKVKVGVLFLVLVLIRWLVK